MPNPFSINRAPKPAKPKIPCTTKRGFAHNWVCEEPADGKVVARCRYCRKKREYSAYLSTYEAFMAQASLTDPALKRNDVGTTSNFR